METSRARSTTIGVAFAALVLAAAAVLALTFAGGSHTVLPGEATSGAQGDISVATDGSIADPAPSGTTAAAATGASATASERSNGAATTNDPADAIVEDLDNEGAGEVTDTRAAAEEAHDDAARATSDTGAEDVKTNDTATTEDTALRDAATDNAAPDNAASDGTPADSTTADEPAAATTDVDSNETPADSTSDDNAAATGSDAAEDAECTVWYVNIGNGPDECACFDNDADCQNFGGFDDLIGEALACGDLEFDLGRGLTLRNPCDPDPVAPEPAPAAPAPSVPVVPVAPIGSTDITDTNIPGLTQPGIIPPVSSGDVDAPDVIEIGCSNGQILTGGICQTPAPAAPAPAAPATIADGPTINPVEDNPDAITLVPSTPDAEIPTIDAPPIAATNTCGPGEILIGNSCHLAPTDAPRLIAPEQAPGAGAATIVGPIPDSVLDSGVLQAPSIVGSLTIDPLAP